jgi:hypothetical protein
MTTLIDVLDNRFELLHRRSVNFTLLVPTEKLYWQPRETTALFPVNSCGEFLLRSAAAVEQTFGGITTRLWDDPFEWTLPEALSTNALIVDYINEVEVTRRRGFTFFNSDDDLRREIPAPEKFKSIFQILVETLSRAEHFQGRAFAVFSGFSEVKLPKFD